MGTSQVRIHKSIQIRKGIPLRITHCRLMMNSAVGNDGNNKSVTSTDPASPINFNFLNSIAQYYQDLPRIRGYYSQLSFKLGAGEKNLP